MTDQPFTRDEINLILDACRAGNHLTVTRSNGGDLTSTVSGPVICDVSRAVGIDLFDGEPHIVRSEDGRVFGAIVRMEVGPRQRPEPEAEPDTYTRHRDSITGRYVDAGEAAARPETTIRETRKP